jgi:hypothetical protein
MTEFEATDGELAPTLFRAVTVNVYDTKLLSPATVHVSELVVQVYPPGEDVAVYDVIVEPPFDDGALHDTVAEFVPPVATAFVGAPGAIADDDTDQAIMIDPLLQVNVFQFQNPAIRMKYVNPLEID